AEPPGGPLLKWDPVSQGRVQVLTVGRGYDEQAIGVMSELERLAGVVPNWSWARAAVIARSWDALESVRSYCELRGSPVQSAADDQGSFWRYREVQSFVDELREGSAKLVRADLLRESLAARPIGAYWDAWWESAV